MSATTSSARDYIEIAKRYEASPPMRRRVDPFAHDWFMGEWLPRWQAVIIEGLMLQSIVEETMAATRWVG